MEAEPKISSQVTAAAGSEVSACAGCKWELWPVLSGRAGGRGHFLGIRLSLHTKTPKPILALRHSTSPRLPLGPHNREQWLHRCRHLADCHQPVTAAVVASFTPSWNSNTCRLIFVASLIDSGFLSAHGVGQGGVLRAILVRQHGHGGRSSEGVFDAALLLPRVGEPDDQPFDCI